jgi:Ni/Fe-hydrogenase subunit HybB-like protein
MPFLVIAGVVLSCLHQSSLGSLMLVAPTKMHVLWYTPVLPLLFLLSAISVGFPVVVFESFCSAKAFGREPETELLSRLARFVPPLLGVLLVARLADLAIRDAWPALLAFDAPAIAFLVEVGVGIALPLYLLMQERVRKSPRGLLLSAILVIGGVLLNRVNVFLTAYSPPIEGGRYVPTPWEILVTLGLFATLALIYRWLVTIFPVLPREESSEAGR